MVDKVQVGWREWVALPDLGISKIKAKIDTGAKTSALHAYYVQPFKKDGQKWVRFGIHPIQDDIDTEVECYAPVADLREVRDSGGNVENRYVIAPTFQVGNKQFTEEITLTTRDTMKFRMLLGRNALNNRCVVDPVKSFLLQDAN